MEDLQVNAAYLFTLVSELTVGYGICYWFVYFILALYRSLSIFYVQLSMIKVNHPEETYLLYRNRAFHVNFVTIAYRFKIPRIM